MLSHSSTFLEPWPLQLMLAQYQGLHLFPLPHFSQLCTIKLTPHIQHLCEMSSPGLVLFSWCAARFSTLITDGNHSSGNSTSSSKQHISFAFPHILPPKILSFYLLCLGSEPAILTSMMDFLASFLTTLNLVRSSSLSEASYLSYELFLLYLRLEFIH